MSAISVRLPESLHRRLKQIAKAEGVSINQFIASAVSEKVAAILTEEYLAERAARGERAAFEAALAKVPAAEPQPGDEL